MKPQHLFLAVILILTTALSCNRKADTQAPDFVDETETLSHYDTATETDVTAYKTDSSRFSSRNGTALVIDSVATETANFIAGKYSTRFGSRQHSDYYKTYRQQIQAAWKKTENEDLVPIKSWIINQHITNITDYEATLFYPFSGPDFLYANSFFPYCRNYILAGLEKIGSMPDLNGLSDEIMQQYLDHIRVSQGYLFKYGYFVTKNMQEHLSRNNLDGTVHLILFYLARTDHNILNITNFHLNEKGEISYSNGTIPGVKIDFCDAGSDRPQTVYYLRLDLENKSLETKKQFLQWMQTFENMITYMKSASYILHDSNFSLIRDLVIARSIRILQDDSGLPFYLFRQIPFDLKLYGTYSKTIKQFKNHFQPELKKALDNQTGDKSLPFTLGYNSWHNETLLMLATRKPGVALGTVTYKPENGQPNEEVVTNQTTDKGLIYSVQFFTASRYYKEGAPEFRGLTGVSYYQTDGVYKYTIGQSKSYADCLPLKEKAIEKGFQGAFVVAFHNGKRITIDEARRLEKQ